LLLLELDLKHNLLFNLLLVVKVEDGAHTASGREATPVSCLVADLSIQA
jgi:hypothetical protein